MRISSCAHSRKGGPVDPNTSRERSEETQEVKGIGGVKRGGELPNTILDVVWQSIEKK